MSEERGLGIEKRAAPRAKSWHHKSTLKTQAHRLPCIIIRHQPRRRLRRPAPPAAACAHPALPSSRPGSGTRTLAAPLCTPFSQNRRASTPRLSPRAPSCPHAASPRGAASPWPQTRGRRAPARGGRHARASPFREGWPRSPCQGPAARWPRTGAASTCSPLQTRQPRGPRSTGRTPWSACPPRPRWHPQSSCSTCPPSPCAAGPADPAPAPPPQTAPR
mmetsp:Transcript_7139/g.18071  ORF Transcript_7139/g.18071 Transcript_7139/m.18071 type:complete len:219 (+) Transcript_7139:39-695(+)